MVISSAFERTLIYCIVSYRIVKEMPSPAKSLHVSD